MPAVLKTTILVSLALFLPGCDLRLVSSIRAEKPLQCDEAKISDNTAPVLTVWPLNHSVLSTSRPQIVATYKDAGSGIDVSSVKLIIDGEDRTAEAGVALSSLSFELSKGEALAEGAHTIHVNVLDKRGNFTEQTQAFAVKTATEMRASNFADDSSASSSSNANQHDLRRTASGAMDPSPYESLAGSSPMSGFGETVSLANGEFKYVLPVLVVPSVGTNWAFTLTYRSQIQYSGSPVGHCWDHNYNQYVRFDRTGSIEYFSGDGRVHRFERRSDPQAGEPLYQPPPGFYAQMIPGSAGFRLHMRDGIIREFERLSPTATVAKLTSIKDRHGNLMAFQYDTDGLLRSVIDPANRRFTYTYDEYSRLKSVKDCGQRVAMLGYHDGTTDQGSKGDLASVALPVSDTYPSGTGWAFTYDNSPMTAKRNLLRVYDPLGTTISAVSGRRFATPIPNEALIINHYDTEDRVVKQEFGRPMKPGSPGGAWEFDYAGPVRVTNPVGDECSWTFHGGNSLQRTLPATQKVNAIVAGKLTEVTWATQFNQDGELVSQTLPRGNRVLYKYGLDEGAPSWALNRGNLLEIQRSSGTISPIPQTKTIRMTYADKQLAPVTSGFNLLLTETDEAGHKVRFVRDAAGNVTQVQTITRTPPVDSGPLPAPSVQHSFTYLDNGLISRMTDALGTNTDFEYNALGNLTKITSGVNNALCVPTAPLSVPSPAPVVRTFEYDDVGNVIVSIDGRGVRTDLTADQYNLIRQRAVSWENSENESSKLSHKTTFDYDALGRVVAVHNDSRLLVKNEGSSFDGFLDFDQTAKSHTVFDILGRAIESKREVGPDESVTSTMSYDALGRLTHVIRTFPDGGDSVTSYTYDARGLVLTIRGAYSITNHYDANGNLTQITDSSGIATTHVFDGFDRLIQSSSGGLVEAIDYNARDLVCRRRIVGPGGQGPDTLLYEVQSDYDERGLIVERSIYNSNPPSGKRKSSVVLVSYDAAGLAVKVQDETGKATAHTYDAFGRRIVTRTSDGDTRSQLVNVYDPEGNIVSAVLREGAGNAADTLAYPILVEQTDATFDAFGGMTLVGNFSSKAKGLSKRHESTGALSGGHTARRGCHNDFSFRELGDVDSCDSVDSGTRACGRMLSTTPINELCESCLENDYRHDTRAAIAAVATDAINAFSSLSTAFQHTSASRGVQGVLAFEFWGFSRFPSWEWFRSGRVESGSQRLVSRLEYDESCKPGQTTQGLSQGFATLYRLVRSGKIDSVLERRLRRLRDSEFEADKFFPLAANLIKVFWISPMHAPTLAATQLAVSHASFSYKGAVRLMSPKNRQEGFSSAERLPCRSKLETAPQSTSDKARKVTRNSGETPTNHATLGIDHPTKLSPLLSRPGGMPTRSAPNVSIKKTAFWLTRTNSSLKKTPGQALDLAKFPFRHLNGTPQTRRLPDSAIRVRGLFSADVDCANRTHVWTISLRASGYWERKIAPSCKLAAQGWQFVADAGIPLARGPPGSSVRSIYRPPRRLWIPMAISAEIEEQT